MNEQSEIKNALSQVDIIIENYNNNSLNTHAFDIKDILIEIREHGEQLYLDTLKLFPNKLLAEIISELPNHLQEEISEHLGLKKLARITSEMDTDDAVDFLQNISEASETKVEKILSKINIEDQSIIKNLMSYEEKEAGSYMQSELFSASEEENVEHAITRLRLMKQNHLIEDLNKVYVVKEDSSFICTIGLEELFLFSPEKKIKDILAAPSFKMIDASAGHKEDIHDIVERVCNYNMSVIPVVDDSGVLIGRITSDDIYDLIENRATDEMYGMVGLNAEVENSESLIESAKSRGIWLFINLLTAIGASCIVGIFDSTISSFVSLAILMPIVASMGGNAGTQSLTLTVRQLSLGEIDFESSIGTIKKEVILSLINGLLFAIIIGLISHFWFNIPNLGIVIALSTIINLLVAGLSGATIPLFLEKVGVDPAVASSVLLTTITDIIGFFSFLSLAKLLMSTT